MDIQLIASTTVALLSPYLVKAGEVIANKASEAIWDKAAQLYQIVKEKFKGNTTAEVALADLEQMPNDEDSQAALRKELKKTMQSDANFGEQLRLLLQEAGKTQQGASIITQIAGKKSTLFGVVHGDVTIGSHSGKKVSGE